MSLTQQTLAPTSPGVSDESPAGSQLNRPGEAASTASNRPGTLVTGFDGPPAVEEKGAAAGGGAGEPAAAPALRIEVRGIPAPQGSKRHVGNGVMVESSKKVKPWRQDVIAAALDVTEKLPKFCNLLTTQISRGIKAPDDYSGGAFEFADGRIEPIARSVTLLPLDCPVHVRMIFSFPRPKSHYRTGRNAHLLKNDAPSQPMGKPDLDKLARSTCDALVTAAVLRDDSRIVEFDRLAKVWCGEDPDALDTAGAVIEVTV